MAQRIDRTHRHRRALERRGWRTLLEYRENHLRDGDGLLIGVVPVWIAEAERGDGSAVVSVEAPSADTAWLRLRSLTLQR